MDFSDNQVHSLKALLVFENTINPELIRSLHVYGMGGGREKEVEREFVFCSDGPYVEMAATPVLKMDRFGIFRVFEGQVFGLWRCLFAFHSQNPPLLTHIPCLLLVSSNPKLASIPNLSHDLQVVFKLSCKPAEAEKPVLLEEKRKEETKDFGESKRRVHVLDQDLNCLPFSVPPSSPPSNYQRNESISLTDIAEKKKRATTKDIARIAMEDVVKYFNLPIAEASRNLNIGLTVLKKKCREFGIPRWPHRKIKSLDNLIRDLQEEAELQKQENEEEAAKAVAKRQRMLKEEREIIERKPFMEIQSETKRFRQDVFKRRHRARALQNPSL